MWRRLAVLGALALAAAALPASAATGLGKLSGTVVDIGGVPQMGATVVVSPDALRGAVEGARVSPLQLLTNDRGQFSSDRLLPGLYSVKVTLAGFLPAVERHVRVDADFTTLLKIELGTLFSTIDQLRRQPSQQSEPDDWAWVLRTSAATRSILRYAEGEIVLASESTKSETAARRTPQARLELTSGSRRPGSVSNLADAPSTAIAYDQRIGLRGRLLLAGQMSYERSAAAGFAAMWLPSGQLGIGPETTLVLRQSKLGPEGLTFRGARMEHNNQLALGDRWVVGYGLEYIMVGLGRPASSLRPNGQISYRISQDWRASFSAGARPWPHAHGQRNALQSALEELDAFPTVLVRNGRPVLEGGWHEELAIERQFGHKARLIAAVFRDRSQHTAVFGRGTAADPEVFQDFFSHGFTYDGGESSSLGSRIAYRQQLNDGTEIVFVYAYGSALVPRDAIDALSLRDALDSEMRHSLAARISTRLPLVRTQLSASYKWLNGPAASRQDAFGEVAYQVDPYMNLTVRQPLPNFLPGRRLEALADFRNLLAQGFVPVSTRDGQILLIPAYRTFRGGLCLQF